MSTPIPETRRVVSAAQRRLWAARFFAGVARGALWGGATLLAVAGTTRVLPVFALDLAVSDAAWIVGAGVLGGAMLGGVLGARRRPRTLAAAMLLDEGGGTRSRLATAFELTNRDDPFSALACLQAEQVSRELDGRALVRPVPSSRLLARCAWGLLAGAAALGIIAWVPAVRWKSALPRENPALAAALRSDAQQAAESVREAVSQLGPDAVDERTAQALAELEQELSSPQAGSPNASPSTARALDEAASALEREAASRAARSRELETLAQAARQAQGSVGEQGSEDPASALRDALAREDAAEAAQAAEELARRVETMEPAERARVQEQLRALADAMREWENSAAEAGDERQDISPRDSEESATSLDSSSMQQDESSSAPSPQDSSPTPSIQESLREAAQRLEEPNEQRDPGQREPVSPKSPEPQPPVSTAPTPTPEAEQQPERGEQRPADASQESSPSQTRQDGGEQRKSDAANAGQQDSSKPQTQAQPQPKPSSTPSGDASKSPATDAARSPSERATANPESPDKQDVPAQETGSEQRPSQSPQSQPREATKPDAAQRQGSKPDSTGSSQQKQGAQGQPTESSTESETRQAPSSETTKPTSTSQASPDARPQPGTQSRPETRPDTSGQSQPQPPSDQAVRRDRPGGSATEKTETTGSPSRPSQEQGPAQSPSPQQSPMEPQAQPGTSQGVQQRPPAGTQQPGAEDGKTQEQSPTGESEGSGASQSLQNLARRLRESHSARDAAQRLGESSQQLREQAQRMLEQSSPQDRRELEQLARELAREGATNQPGDGGGDAVRGPTLPVQPSRAGDTSELPRVPVDARERGRLTRERTIAELMPNPADRASMDGSRAPNAADGLIEAVEGAQRGIESQSVPPQRSDLVRRVFQRYRERVQPAATPPARETPRSPDAPAISPAPTRSGAAGGGT